MAELAIKGLKINYEVQGEGQVVVLLHHGFASGRMWKDLTQSIVEAGYRVLVYDRRGYGYSEGGEDFRDFYLGDGFRPWMVEELWQLTQALGMARLHLVGQCEGGVVAADFAAAHPEVTASLVIAGAQCLSHTDMASFCAQKFPIPFKETDPAYQEKFAYWHAPQRAEWLYDFLKVRGGAYGSGVFDLRPVLKRIQCPALVIYPDRSGLFPVEQGVMLYRHLEKGELAVLPGCGHNTYELRPKEYLNFILDFFKRLGKEEPQPSAFCCAHTGPVNPR